MQPLGAETGALGGAGQSWLLCQVPLRLEPVHEPLALPLDPTFPVAVPDARGLVNEKLAEPPFTEPLSVLSVAAPEKEPSSALPATTKFHVPLAEPEYVPQ